jgi:voltage-gated potassium channel
MFVPFIEGNSPLGHNSNQSPRTAVVSFLDCLYFIVTTQKTVGYGDIIPIFVLGNACSIVQGVFGYLYLAFLISILASKAIMESRKIKYTFKVKKLKGQVLLYCKY